MMSRSVHPYLTGNPAIDTLTPFQSDAVTRLLTAHRDGGHDVDVDPAAAPDATSVYRIQHAVAGSLGPTGGFKTAPGSPWGDRAMAPIFRDRVFDSGQHLTGAGSHLRGVELEIGFRIVDAPPAPDQPDFETALRAVVVPCAVLEIVESRLRDPEAAGAAWKLADNGINGALIRTDGVADWSTIDLSTPMARLQIGERLIHDGPAQVPGGDAFASLVEFARGIGDHCGGLQAGHTVITGSLTGLEYAAAGDTVSGTIDGLGNVAMQFE